MAIAIASKKAIGRPHHHRLAKNTRSSLMWPAKPVPGVPNLFSEITFVQQLVWSTGIRCMTKVLPIHPNFGLGRGKPNSGPTAAFWLEKL
jgi:hypothetical protein